MDELAAMGEGEILDLAAVRAERIRADEVDLLKLAYHWAVLHDPNRLDPEESARPGREKAKRYGGDGTPQVCEFAAANQESLPLVVEIYRDLPTTELDWGTAA